MKRSETPVEMLKRRYSENAAEMARLAADQEQIRKMLAAAQQAIPDDTPDEVLAPRSATVTQLRVYSQERSDPSAPLPCPSPPTMRNLVRVALGYRFPNGATKAQMIAFFNRDWGQKVQKESLGPLLTNMRHAGEITSENLVWYLVKKEGSDDASQTLL